MLKKIETLATQALYRHLTIDVITIGTKAQLLGAKFLIDMCNVPCDCTRLKAWSGKETLHHTAPIVVWEKTAIHDASKVYIAGK